MPTSDIRESFAAELALVNSAWISRNGKGGVSAGIAFKTKHTKLGPAFV